jgi:hypothetical protein
MIGLLRCLLALSTLLGTAPSGAPSLAGSGSIKVLYYSPGVMARVARCHMDPRCGDAGDYVPTLRIRPDVQCLTAVNWGARSLVAQNALIVVDFRDRSTGKDIRVKCQAVDWEQIGHASSKERKPDISRLEIDYSTAARIHAVPANTTAKLVRVEK